MRPKTSTILAFSVNRTMFFSLLFIFLAVTACQTNNPRARVNKFDISSSPQSGDELSKRTADRLHSSLLRYFPEISDPLIKNYINKVSGKITQALPPIQNCCRYYLIRMNTVNAFSLPNGNIYITVELLSLLNSEAQLAAVLSHEIAHVAAKHSVKDINNKFLTYKVYKALHRRGRSARLNDISATLGQAYVKGYKREIEREADTLGLKYMAIAGYHPNAMAEVFRNIKSYFNKNPRHQKYSKIVYTRDRGIFASYPSFDARISQTQQLINTKIKPKLRHYPTGLIEGRDSFAPIKKAAIRIRKKTRTQRSKLPLLP